MPMPEQALQRQRRQLPSDHPLGNTIEFQRCMPCPDDSDLAWHNQRFVSYRFYCKCFHDYLWSIEIKMFLVLSA